MIKQLINKNQKGLAVLIDPDKTNTTQTRHLAQQIDNSAATMVLVGGSLITTDRLAMVIQTIKENTAKPVVIFPGNYQHISPTADGILLLSLLSGRNPDLLIGQHVAAAPLLKNSGLEIIPTGYILIDGGTVTTVQYISNTMPIPPNKPDIATCTAMAGEMLGLGLIYLDAGSGAKQAIPPALISAVKQNLNIPLWVGGGIRNTQTALAAYNAGANWLVVGNGIETNPNLLAQLSDLL